MKLRTTLRTNNPAVTKTSALIKSQDQISGKIPLLKSKFLLYAACQNKVALKLVLHDAIFLATCKIPSLQLISQLFWACHDLTE